MNVDPPGPVDSRITSPSIARADIRAIASPSPIALMGAGVERLALLERSEDPRERLRRRCRDLRRSRGSPRSPPRARRGRARAVLRGERDGVLDELLQDAAGGQAVQAGHGRSRSAPRRGCARWPPATSRATSVTSAHSVRPASTAASNRWTSRARSPARDDEAFQQLSARLLRRGAAGERLRHAEDHGHRGAELVAQAGDELVAAGGPLEQGLLRDLELTRAAALALERLGQLLDDGRRELRRDDAAAGRRPHGRRSGSRRRRSP